MLYARRHNTWKVVKRFSRGILGAAAYYAFTKNNHFWDRILFFCRDLQKRGSLIYRTRLYYSSKWDDCKRFVYSQVIFQTHWLLSRALRPRDKSYFFKNARLGSTWSNPSQIPPRSELTNQVRDIAYAMSHV